MPATCDQPATDRPYEVEHPGYYHARIKTSGREVVVRVDGSGRFLRIACHEMLGACFPEDFVFLGRVLPWSVQQRLTEQGVERGEIAPEDLE